MSAAEEALNPDQLAKPRTAPIGNRLLDFISSVRFGVFLLCLLVVLSMIGMLIIQQNVQGFDSYYNSLTPAERLVYGSLGLFDVYHSWYFNVLLLILSLNIILASIDHFPSSWSYIAKPKLTATKAWLLGQKQNAVVNVSAANPEEAASRVAEIFKQNGLSPRITESEEKTYAVGEDGKKDFQQTTTKKRFIVFGESGRLNRLGAYVVHVALLTLFIGHFVALRTGFDADVRMIPGDKTDQIQLIQFELDKREKFNVQLPFTITCTDIQQTLVNPGGAIDVSNTMDWRTQIKIADPEYGETTADVALNKPFSYRGYRFFQAQTIPIGNARSIKLSLTPQAGGDPVELTIPRLGMAELADGTRVEYEDFQPDFTFNAQGQPDTRSGDYNNPVAVLGVTPPGGERTRVFAFAANLSDTMPVAAPKLGYKWRLSEWEKSPFAHVLSIKYDPYSGAFIAWYFGGIGLIFALAFVFFISHKRVWAMIEDSPEGYQVILGGDTNRNHAGFEDKFNILKEKIAAS